MNPFGCHDVLNLWDIPVLKYFLLKRRSVSSSLGCGLVPRRLFPNGDLQ